MRKIFFLLVLLQTARAQAPMPPNTIQLSEMMRQLSDRPGFTEALLNTLEGHKGHKQGPALLTPALLDELRKVILGKDWQRLDHFPGWSMGQINPTVRVIGHEVGHDAKLDATATAGGAPAAQGSTRYLDVGPYTLDKSETVDLGTPAPARPFVTADFVSPIGDGVIRGDGPSPLAANHAESIRIANLLNRLAMNGFPGVKTLEVSSAQRPPAPASPAQRDAAHVFKFLPTYTTPEALIKDLQQTGHAVTVTDTRYFANFGHLHFNGQDVMVPFYVNALIRVPDTDRPLLVPVSHAEYEWHIRGPVVNADVSFYFGIDGHAEWRTMDQLDQAWVMKRDAHTYTGADAIEVTRLNAAIVQAWQRLHQANPGLPFGGYYGLGVCQDVVAAVELKMTGKTTLFPNTADNTFFTNPQDAEINTLIRRLPKDRNGRLPEPERIFGSLPVGQSDAELATIPIPGLATDLIAVHEAWTRGNLHRIRPTHHLRDAGLILGALILAGILYWTNKRRNRA